MKPEDFLELASNRELSELERQWLPWDQFRHRTPSNVSPENAWVWAKLARRSRLRALPRLLDVNGRPFRFALPDSHFEKIEWIARSAAGDILVSELVTTQDNAKRYIVSSLIEEAITSSQLEGASTTREVAKSLIRSGRNPKDNSERMILNNYRVMERILALRNESLTPELVHEIHRIATDGTLRDPSAAGRIQRPMEDRIAVYAPDGELVHRPPAAEELPARLERLCEFANETASRDWMPSVVRAICLHFGLAYDHPFVDGNGRTARALFYWSMLRSGFWLAEYISISRLLRRSPARYARSFQYVETDEGDVTYFIGDQLAVIVESIKELKDHLKSKMDKERSVRAQLASFGDEFNDRQIAILRRALENVAEVFTVKEHSQAQGISDESARNDLAALAERGLLVKRKRGRVLTFIPISNLASTLNSFARASSAARP